MHLKNFTREILQSSQNSPLDLATAGVVHFSFWLYQLKVCQFQPHEKQSLFH